MLHSFALRAQQFSYYVLATGLVVVPLFFWRWPGVYDDVSKKFLLIFFVLLALLLWGIHFFVRDGKIILPKNLIALGVGAVILTTLISSITSGAVFFSWFGLGAESGTVISLLAFLVVSFLCSQFYQTENRILGFYLGFFVVYLLGAIFQLAVFFTHLIPAGYLGVASQTLFGKLTDFGIASGFVVMSAMVLLDHLIAKDLKLFRALIWLVSILALLFLVISNFYQLWWVMFILSVVFCIYSFRLSRFNSKHRRFFNHSFFVLLCALVLVLFGSGGLLSQVPLAKVNGNSYSLTTVVDQLNKQLGISYLEIRPNLTSTATVATQTYLHHPLFGVGPNLFSSAWAKYKPQTFNQTNYWNTGFQSGYGFLPTVIIESGLLGLLAWALFLLAVIYYSYRALARFHPLSSREAVANNSLSEQERLDALFILFPFISFLYFLIAITIAVADTTILLFFFVVTGILIARLIVTAKAESGLVIVSFQSIKSARAQIIGSAVFFLLLFVVIIYLFLIALSLWEFSRGYFALGAGKGAETAETYVRRAAGLRSADIYSRTLVGFDLQKMDNLLASSGLAKSVLTTKFEAVVKDATAEASRAINFNPNNFDNYLTSGHLYQKLISLNILGAYTKAKDDLNLALELNPHNPTIYYNLALVELAGKDTIVAEENISKALAEKPDYLEALILQAQMSLQAGQIDLALKQLRSAVALAPNDAKTLFQLGYWQYQAGDYSGAVVTLRQVEALSPGFANAEYFLGLALDKLGNKKEALALFKGLLDNNPNNAELAQIVKNLTAGKSALVKSKTMKR